SSGRLQRGAQGAAGDIGHIRASEYLDEICACGNAGCIEAVASGSALARRLRALGHDTDGAMDVVVLVPNGSADAVRLVREAGRLLGEVLAHAVNLMNPSVLVIGGGPPHAQHQLFRGPRAAGGARGRRAAAVRGPPRGDLPAQLVPGDRAARDRAHAAGRSRGRRRRRVARPRSTPGARRGGSPARRSSSRMSEARSDTALLEVRGLIKVYPGVTALAGVD